MLRATARNPEWTRFPGSSRRPVGGSGDGRKFTAQSRKVAEPRIASTSVGVLEHMQGASARTIAFVPRRRDDDIRTVAVELIAEFGRRIDLLEYAERE